MLSDLSSPLGVSQSPPWAKAFSSLMTSVTFKVLHGADRGKIFESLTLPFTVGREEGNDIQLNDERISRCHFKVQKDNDRLVLTDLDSTNGTKVNGVECQLRILRHGDLIAVGRSLMLVGSETQIASRLAAMGSDGPTMNRAAIADGDSSEVGSEVASSVEGDSAPSPLQARSPRRFAVVADRSFARPKSRDCRVGRSCASPHSPID